MNPKERAALCGTCTLKTCNEAAKGCLIRIKGLEDEVRRKVVSFDRVRPASIADTLTVNRRRLVVERAITEILSMGKMSEATVDAMIEPYRRAM
jgi:hypothetical protein